jgi:hypothetical protein
MDKCLRHPTGLWYYLPKQDTPSLTMIGSPNFGMEHGTINPTKQPAAHTHVFLIPMRVVHCS